MISQFLMRVTSKKSSLLPPTSIMNWILGWKELKSNFKLNHLKNHFIQRVLRLELNDTFRKTCYLRTELFRLVRDITCHLPIRICDNFFKRHEKACYFYFISRKKRIESNSEWLSLKQKKLNNKNIQSIKYFY